MISLKEWRVYWMFGLLCFSYMEDMVQFIVVPKKEQHQATKERVKDNDSEWF